jgi:hypothetical protein
MPQIVNLDALVPDDLEFQYRGAVYKVPGDLPTETVFSLFEKYRKVIEAQMATSEDGADPKKTWPVVERASTEMRDAILHVFQIMQPDLQSLPFGTSAMPHVTQNLLSLLGIEIGETEPDPTPAPKMAPTLKTRKPSQRRRKSTSSRGSTSS